MAERKKTNGSLALEDAFLKLVTVIQTIELRQSGDHPIEDIVRPHEAKRIQYAFDLIHETRRLVVSKAEERREKYRHFLLQLKDDELVVAGALGLGQTAIGNMKEAPRLRLPIKLKQRKNDFGSSLLASLAQAYSKKDVTRTNNASKEKRTLPPAVPISSSEMQPIPTTPPVSGSSVIPFENLPSTSETRDPEYQQRNSSFSPRQEERPLEAGQSELNLLPDGIII
ncbi:hypothetical protein CBS147311_9345 [Penicillium roqueforti]|nr:hypothetical protein CBS147311_9345 [Penicillium roqueforti]